MKKGFVIFFLILSCLLLSACTIGEEKTEVLSCTKPDYASGISYVETDELTFQGKKVSEYKLKLKFDLNGYNYTEEEFENATDKLREEYSKAIERGVRTDVYPEGRNVYAIFTIDPELFDGFLDYIKHDLSPVFKARYAASEYKPEMEKRGYTCEIK